MTWMESLAQLKILGYSFYRGKNTVKYKYSGQCEPQRTQVQPLLKVLAENKAEVLKALKDEPSQNEPLRPDESSILGMRLKQFGESRTGIRVWSEILAKEIWMVPEDSDIRGITHGQTCYTATELELLINSNLGPEGLRLFDSTKEIFSGAKIVEIRKRPGCDPGLT